ncbi:hemolysin family protein [Dinoroseobacter sp. S76]|uniref:hemolysin family protein n=1 Tax=Dinoroseobacter sp. S76 TaxID=3415124 RepID=UPI003C7D0475
MADTSDGSSSAARRALNDETTAARPSLLRRLLAAFSTQEDSEPESEAEGSHASHDARASGLGIGNLRRMRVVDVAIPRADIVAVPSDITQDELVQVFRDSGMTRLPVYRSTLDTPLGMVHLKDLALNFGFNGTSRKFSLKGMLRPLLYAPPSMPIGVLLQKMQKDRMHMALVIDEYGGTDGLVTIEDLIEQVIGEIEDEHDEPEDRFWSREKPGVYLVQAKAPLTDLEEELGISLIEPGTEEEIDTLGGLVFKLTGRVPVRGEVIPHDSGVEFEVVDADPRRIKRVRIRLRPAERALSSAAE